MGVGWAQQRVTPLGRGPLEGTRALQSHWPQILCSDISAHDPGNVLESGSSFQPRWSLLRIKGVNVCVGGSARITGPWTNALQGQVSRRRWDLSQVTDAGQERRGQAKARRQGLLGCSPTTCPRTQPGWGCQWAPSGSIGPSFSGLLDSCLRHRLCLTSLIQLLVCYLSSHVHHRGSHQKKDYDFLPS